MPLSEIEEEGGEEAIAIEVASSPATPQQEACSADVPKSHSDDGLEDGDNTPYSSSGTQALTLS